MRAQLLIDVLNLFTNSGFSGAKIITCCLKRPLLSHCENRNLPVNFDVQPAYSSTLERRSTPASQSFVGIVRRGFSY